MSDHAHLIQPLVLVDQIKELKMECARDGWDGYGASAPSNGAYQAAMRFVEALPAGFQMPEVAVDPDGCFTFAWRRDKCRTVLVSVNFDHTLHFASLIGPSREFGEDVFFDELPVSIRELVERLYSD